jgi:hypothetical protein
VSRNAEFRTIPDRFDITVPPLNLTELTEQALRQVIGAIHSSIKTHIPGRVLQANHPVKSTKKPNSKMLQNPEVLAALSSKHNNACRICHIPNSNQFYVSGKCSIIRRMNTEGTVIEEIITKSGKSPNDLTVNMKGYLMYVDCKDRSINIHKNSEIECLNVPQGWTPQAICSTSTDDLLVTMVSNDYEQNKVVRYSGSTITQEIQNSETGEPLFSDPCYINENKNFDIVVSDFNAKTVVVVDKGGKFRFDYHGNVHLGKIFSPYGITTDSMCHILIADGHNHMIHIIDEDGRLLRYIKNCNLKLPHDLSTDSNNMLFVAEFDTGVVKEIKYLD